MPAVPIWFGPRPVEMTCPYCETEVVTHIIYKANNYTWCCCWSMAFCGLILGCCLIPFKIKSCQDCVHCCPRCEKELGESTICGGHKKYFRQTKIIPK